MFVTLTLLLTIFRLIQPIDRYESKEKPLVSDPDHINLGEGRRKTEIETFSSETRHT